MEATEVNEIKEYRADGWPLCPQCEEDELYSLLQWDGIKERPPLAEWIAAGLRCYRCNWSKMPLDKPWIGGNITT